MKNFLFDVLFTNIPKVMITHKCSGWIEFEKKNKENFSSFFHENLKKLDSYIQSFFSINFSTKKILINNNIFKIGVNPNIIKNIEIELSKFIKPNFSEFELFLLRAYSELIIPIEKNYIASSNKKFQEDKLPFVRYNLFSAKTGRLGTVAKYFPILTIKKEERNSLKTTNHKLIELDFNSAELRTILSLSENQELNKISDIHKFNSVNIFQKPHLPRKLAKTFIFKYIYGRQNAEDYAFMMKSDYMIDVNIDVLNKTYNRTRIIKEHSNENNIETIFGRAMSTEKDKIFNYIVQSTTSDLFISQMLKIQKILQGRKSFIKYLIHDSFVLDFHDEDFEVLKQIIKAYKTTRLGLFPVNYKIL